MNLADNLLESIPMLDMIAGDYSKERLLRAMPIYLYECVGNVFSQGGSLRCEAISRVCAGISMADALESLEADFLVNQEMMRIVRADLIGAVDNFEAIQENRSAIAYHVELDPVRERVPSNPQRLWVIAPDRDEAMNRLSQVRETLGAVKSFITERMVSTISDRARQSA